MELEPAKIRNQSFKKQTFGGYKPAAVQQFLLQVAEAYSQMQQEKNSLSIRLKETQETVDRVRGIEEALLQALKQAETQKEEIINQSKKEAELRMMEGEVAAEALLNTAKQKAQQMIQDVKNECEQKMNRMKLDFEVLDQSYYEVEAHVNKMLAQMQAFVEETNQHIAHLSSIKNQKVVEKKLSTAKQLLKESPQKPTPFQKTAQTQPKNSPKVRQVASPSDSTPSPSPSLPDSPKPRTLHETLMQQQKGEESMKDFFKGIDDH